MSATSDEHGRRIGPLTLETAAYGLLALLAIALRWTQLGLQPLSQAEAAQALAAYRFLHGEALVPEGTVPALFTANVAGFALFGAGDPTARWLPALAGVALVLLPWGLRSRLGRGGALAASALLAFSPTAVYQSRLLDGTVVAAACGLAVVVGSARFVDTHRPGWLYLAAGALGLGLCAGAAIWTLLLVLLLFGLVPVLVGAVIGRPGGRRGIGWPGLAAAYDLLRHQADWAAKAGIALAAVLGLTATAFALRPENAGLAADLLGEWAQDLSPAPGGPPSTYPLLLLVRYEPLVLILGLMGAGAVLSRRHSAARGFPLDALLVFWALAATLLAVVAGHRTTGGVLLAVVPLALLAGQWMERAWQWARWRVRWGDAVLVAGAIVALAVFVYLQLTAFSLTGVETVDVAGRALPAGTGYLLLALLALVLLIGVGAAVSTLRGPEVLVGGAGLALILVLGWWGVKSAWAASHLHAGDPRELMIARTTAPDLRKLVGQVELLSQNRAGDRHALRLAVDRRLGPAMDWALREFERQVDLEAAGEPPEVALIETEREGSGTGTRPDTSTGASYRGEVFPFQLGTSSWQPAGLRSQALVRWLIFGTGSEPVRDRDVTLWVRIEQGQGQGQ